MSAANEPQPVEPSEHRQVPTVTEHNERMREQRPDDCVGGQR